MKMIFSTFCCAGPALQCGPLLNITCTSEGQVLHCTMELYQLGSGNQNLTIMSEIIITCLKLKIVTGKIARKSPTMKSKT